MRDDLLCLDIGQLYRQLARLVRDARGGDSWELSEILNKFPCAGYLDRGAHFHKAEDGRGHNVGEVDFPLKRRTAGTLQVWSFAPLSQSERRAVQTPANLPHVSVPLPKAISGTMKSDSSIRVPRGRIRPIHNHIPWICSSTLGT